MLAVVGKEVGVVSLLGVVLTLVVGSWVRVLGVGVVGAAVEPGILGTFVVGGSRGVAVAFFLEVMLFVDIAPSSLTVIVSFVKLS